MKASSMALAVPHGNINAYMATVSGIPILTAEEERELAEKLHHEDDLDAARTLVLSHLRFVVHIAKGYSGYGLPEADIIQEGNVGLMKAVKRFDPSFGVRLISFAVHWIKAEIHEYVLKNWRIVKVATTKSQRKLFFNLRSAKSRLGWFNNGEVDAVAKDLGVSPEEVRRMEGRLHAHDAAFDPAGVDDDENAFAPAQYLQAEAADPAEINEQANWQDHHQQRLAQAIAKLDERSQDILRLRWLSEDKQTLQQVADKYEISAERVRQLENNAIKKLKLSML